MNFKGNVWASVCYIPVLFMLLVSIFVPNIEMNLIYMYYDILKLNYQKTSKWKAYFDQHCY